MRDLSAHVHWLNARLHVIVATIVSLLVAVGFGVSAGEGDFRLVYVALLGTAVVAVMGMLGDKYWLLIPFSVTAQLPAIPVMRRTIELPEIIIALCTITFACRYALKRQRFTLFRAAYVPILLYSAWAGMIFFLNPVGLEAMGAETGGARFYAKLALALASFLILVNQQITERDCWIVVLLGLAGAILGSATNILTFFLSTPYALAADLDAFSYYSWQQNICIAPLMVVTLLLSRFKSSEIFSFHRVGLAVLFAVCCLLIVASGKRAAVAAVPVLMVAAAVIRKEYNFVFLWMGGAVLGFALLVAFHGTLFSLPLTAQRSLSWLPGRWDASLAHMEGGKDEFRKRLRELAVEKISADPWVGKGYAVDRRLSALIAATPNQSEKLILQMAQGSAWHNTWLGYAADFGIPAAALQAVIYGSIVWMGWRLTKRLPAGSMMLTIVLYVLLHTVRDIGGSHHDGHSSVGPFLRWWMYGLVIAISTQSIASRPKGGAANRDIEESPTRRSVGHRLRPRQPVATGMALGEPAQHHP
jgi:hypothetical protein